MWGGAARSGGDPRFGFGFLIKPSYLVIMSRFQSRLFNWIDRSLPAKLGRSLRRSLDQTFASLAGASVSDVSRLLAYQVAKAALYPVYAIASSAKRTFPALERRKVEPKEKLRSQPEAAGLLPESNEIKQEEIRQEESKPDDKAEIPMLLRPLAKLLNWLDGIKSQIDRNIAAIVKRSPDHLATNAQSSPSLKIDADLIPIANRIFAEIWQQQVEQRQSDQSQDEQSQDERNPLKENNGLVEKTDLVKNTRLEQLRRLIAAAIAYFMNKKLSQPTIDQTSDMIASESFGLAMADVFGDDNGPWPHPLDYESHAFSKSPDRIAIHSSGELENFETTTTQISQDQLKESLVFEEDLLAYQNTKSNQESDRPLRAWIEANATILGYVYNPVMTVILWVDAIVLKVEELIIVFWKRLIILPKQLIYFIRYGNRDQK